ncbi:MAG: DNA gyrase subunit A, partial [Anaerolineales bacterium]
GMSTSIPPHNLSEVCDALVYMLQRWTKLNNVQIEDLMKFIHGPDFPTGGLIVLPEGEDPLAVAYGSGRGKITVQAKAYVEEMSRGRSRIIITELPYQTNKASLIERVADLAREGRVEGITDLRDESDRQGLRIVIELARTAAPDIILRRLYKVTPMQGTFSIINLALVGGEPRMLTLKQALRVFLEHRMEVVRRRSEHDLARAKERAHILEGLLKAIKFLDEVIKIIRGSRDTDTARTKLRKRFRFTERQANAILDMPLKRLARLEQRKLQDEYKELKARVKHLEGLLKSPKKMRDVIAAELTEIKSAFGDARRTQIVSAGGDAPVRAADLVPDEQVWVIVTRNGRVSRARAKSKRPKLGRQAPVAVVRATTRDTLYLITAKGRAAALSTHTLPSTDDPGRGAPWASVSALESAARVTAAVAIPAAAVSAESNGAGPNLFLATAAGMVKNVSLADLPGPSSRPFGVINVADGDQLIGARVAAADDEVLLFTQKGMSIRFKCDEVRPMGLGASGVAGIKLGNGDRVVSMALAPRPEVLRTPLGAGAGRPRADVLMVDDAGKGKRTPLNQFPTQGRYGKGVQAWKMAGKARLVGAAVGPAANFVAAVTEKNRAKVIKYSSAPRRGRPARGARLVTLAAKDAIDVLVPYLEPVEIETAKPKKPRRATARKAPARKKSGAKKKSARKNPTKKRSAKKTPKKKSAKRK